MEVNEIAPKESIKLTKNAKGDYQWEVKVHIEDIGQSSKDVALTKLKAINEELETKYGKKS